MAIAMAEPPTENTQNEDPLSEELDDEISALRAQVKSLKSHRSIQLSTILSSRSTQTLLSRLPAQPPPPSVTAPTTTTTTTTVPQPDDLSPLLSQSTAQSHLTTTNLHRALSTLTTFRVQDPDPSAASSGSILGLRIEAFSSTSSGSKFIRPYYLFLNRPYAHPHASTLRVHRHTLPPCIPVAALAARYLPAPPTTPSGTDPTSRKSHSRPRPQNFPLFARSLRHAIASYHNRLSAIAALRRVFHLETRRSGAARDKGKNREANTVMRDISSADAEACHIRLEWLDGRIGRAVMDGKGRVVRCVVIGEGGREREVERRVLGGGGRVEGMGGRILGT